MAGKFGAFLELSRAKMLVASIAHASLGLMLGAGTLDNFIRLETAIYIVLLYSVAILACNINCLYDYEVDRRHKRYMSDSLDVFGKNNLKIIIIIEFIIASVLISYFFFEGFLITSGIAVLGLFSAIAYSAEPLRIKKRGFFSPLPVMFGFYMLPILGGWFIFQDWQTLPFIIFAIGYLAFNQGYTFVNMAEDYSEDREEGIRTWAHIFGIRMTLDLAFFLAVAGLLAPASLLLVVLESPGVDLLYALKTVAILFSALTITLVALEVEKSRHGKDLETSAKKYGPRLPKWFMMSRFPLMLAAFLLFL